MLKSFFKNNYIQILISFILVITFAFGDKIIDTIIISIVYQGYFMSFHFHPLIEEQKRTLNDFLSKHKDENLKLDEDFFKRTNKFAKNTLNLIVYSCLNIPIILYGAFAKYLKSFDIYSICGKIGFCVTCFFIMFAVCLILIGCTKEYKAIKEINEIKRNDAKLESYKSEINELNIYLSYNEENQLNDITA